MIRKSFTAKLNILEQRNAIAFSIFYQILSLLTHSGIVLSVKLLKHIPTYQIILYRNIYQLILSYSFRTVNDINIEHFIKDKSKLTKIYVRCLLGLDQISFYYAVIFVTMSEAFVILRLAPFFVALIVMVILRRRKSDPVIFVEVFICFIGVLLVMKPPFFLELIGQDFDFSQQHEYHLLGIFLILYSALSMAIQQVLLNDLGSEISSIVVVDYYSLSLIIFASLLQISSNNCASLSIREHFQILLVALFGFSTQFLFTKSFSLGNVTQISLVGNLQIVFGLLIDALILGKSSDGMSLIGSFVILSSIIFDTVYQRRKSMN